MPRNTQPSPKTAKSPKVLFLGKRYYTNRDALEEQYGRIYQLPLHWNNSGIPTHLRLIDYHTRQTIERVTENLPVTSTPIVSFDIARILLRLLFISQNYTHVIASGDCYIGLLGYVLAKRLRSVFIFDVYDKYDNFSGYRQLPGLSPFPFLLSSSDKRLFASQRLIDQLGHPEKGDIVVANGVDTNRFRPLEIAQCRQTLDLPMKEFFIGYFGSMEVDRGVNDLINSVEQLRSEGTSIKLLIGGKQEPNVDLSKPSIRYVGNVPFQQMPFMLGACNLLAIPYRRSSFMDAGASNKIAEAIACRRPIVATRTPNLTANFPDIARLLEERLALPADPSSLVKAIRAQLTAPILGSLPPGWDWASIAHKAARDLELLSAMPEHTHATRL